MSHCSPGERDQRVWAAARHCSVVCTAGQQWRTGQDRGSGYKSPGPHLLKEGDRGTLVSATLGPKRGVISRLYVAQVKKVFPQGHCSIALQRVSFLSLEISKKELRYCRSIQTPDRACPWPCLPQPGSCPHSLPPLTAVEVRWGRCTGDCGAQLQPEGGLASSQVRTMFSMTLEEG